MWALLSGRNRWRRCLGEVRVDRGERWPPQVTSRRNRESRRVSGKESAHLVVSSRCQVSRLGRHARTKSHLTCNLAPRITPCCASRKPSLVFAGSNLFGPLPRHRGCHSADKIQTPISRGCSGYLPSLSNYPVVLVRCRIPAAGHRRPSSPGYKGSSIRQSPLRFQMP